MDYHIFDNISKRSNFEEYTEKVEREARATLERAIEIASRPEEEFAAPLSSSFPTTTAATTNKRKKKEDEVGHLTTGRVHWLPRL